MFSFVSISQVIGWEGWVFCLIWPVICHAGGFFLNSASLQNSVNADSCLRLAVREMKTVIVKTV